MKVICFDTETTGTPRLYNASMKDLDNWPRVIQLAWIQFEMNGNVLKEREMLIKPDGWVVPDGQFWRDHGFNTQRNMDFGIPIKQALDELIQDIEESDILIAHNMNFDYNVIGAEMIRAKVAAKTKPKKFCTMKSTIDYCALPGKFGYKFPKLEELHNKLFGTGFDGAHDAYNDTRAAMNCFIELTKRNIIDLNVQAHT